jgi:hypothetical protein
MQRFSQVRQALYWTPSPSRDASYDFQLSALACIGCIALELCLLSRFSTCKKTVTPIQTAWRGRIWSEFWFKFLRRDARYDFQSSALGLHWSYCVLNDNLEEIKGVDVLFIIMRCSTIKSMSYAHFPIDRSRSVKSQCSWYLRALSKTSTNRF